MTSITTLDVLLLIVVTLQVTLLAYLRTPKSKVLLLGLPFPFTVITLSIGDPVDATNIVALAMLFCFNQVIRLLHQRFRVPIIPAIVCGISFYIGVSWCLAQILPPTEGAFWVSSALVLVLGWILHKYMPIRLEPGHRSSLPLWKKLPVIVAVVFLVLLTRNFLRGFSTLFPMVAVVGAYEARHSLWAVGRQTPIVMFTLTILMAVSRFTWESIGLGPSLLVGWVVFLITLTLILRPMWLRWDAMQNSEPFNTGTSDPSTPPQTADLPQAPT
jgi:hypothetical protein